MRFIALKQRSQSVVDTGNTRVCTRSFEVVGNSSDVDSLLNSSCQVLAETYRS